MGKEEGGRLVSGSQKKDGGTEGRMRVGEWENGGMGEWENGGKGEWETN